MYIEEFLIKLGFDAKGANQFNTAINIINMTAIKLENTVNNVSSSMSTTLNGVGNDFEKTGDNAEKASQKISKTQLVLKGIISSIAGYGSKIASVFEGAIKNAKDLYLKKDALFKISKNELSQVDKYHKAMDATEIALKSIATKIALKLAPAVTDIANDFRNWLSANKDLISDGINKVTHFLSKALKVIVNTSRFIDKIVTSTIGWENALILLGIAWAIFNKALLFSPIGIIIGAITVLMLLINDLMTYMDGGESVFGKYWQPLIDGAKNIWKIIKSVWNLIKAIWEGDSDKIKSVSNDLFNAFIQGCISLYDGIKSIFASILKAILKFFGMSEGETNKTVDKIGKIFSFILDLITLPFRLAYKAVKNIMDYFGIDAGDVVNTIITVFSTIFEFISRPFRLAYAVIKSIMDHFGINVSNIVDTIINVFSTIFEFISRPFRLAYAVIKSIMDHFGIDASDIVNAIINVFSTIFEYITLPFRLAYEAIKNIMDYFGIDAGDVVNAIITVFSTLFDALVAPFKFAWGIISDLLNIWENDTISLKDKIVESFANIGGKLIEPFKFAITWVKDKFLGAIRSAVNKVKGWLSWFGISVENNSNLDDKLDNEKIISAAKSGAVNNNSKTIHQGNMTNYVTVNTSDTQVGANQIGSLFTKQLTDANNNTKSALGSR